jgi:quinol monooxygenase YgiN
MQVHLDVFPPGLAPTLAAVKEVAEAARKGEGNRRYDVVQSVKTPLSHMTLFAAWQNRKAFDAYEMSDYARQFRDTVGPLLGSPFDDLLYVLID